MREMNFDGLVGLTHNYGGLSPGNIASMSHGGQISNPKEAAQQGLRKMRFNRELGLPQGVLPPHERPNVRFLRSVGFSGSDEDVIAAAASGDGQLLRLSSSAAAMWTANAATIAPSCDTTNGRLNVVPANLSTMLHRAQEARTTHRVLARIFADDSYFRVHEPLPADHFSDEGAANHTRLVGATGRGIHLLAWGRSVYDASVKGPQRFVARQTLEASTALKRLLALPEDQAVLWQQAAAGIDAGAFHTDVMAVGNDSLLLLHDQAFEETQLLLQTLKEKVGDNFRYVLASSDELPAEDAVASYCFNSQLVTLPSGSMAIIAPVESQENDKARRFLDRVQNEDVNVSDVHFLDLRQSMHNGGGPACLRLRVPLTDEERGAMGARVETDDELLSALSTWIDTHYRDRMVADDLKDAKLWREVMAALDELTQILDLGSVYDFQMA